MATGLSDRAEWIQSALLFGITEPEGDKNHIATWSKALRDKVDNLNAVPKESSSFVEIVQHAHLLCRGLKTKGHRGHKQTWRTAIAEHLENPNQKINLDIFSRGERADESYSEEDNDDAPHSADTTVMTEDDTTLESLVDLIQRALNLGIVNPTGHKGYKETWSKAIEERQTAKFKSPDRKESLRKIIQHAKLLRITQPKGPRGKRKTWITAINAKLTGDVLSGARTPVSSMVETRPPARQSVRRRINNEFEELEDREEEKNVQLDGREEENNVQHEDCEEENIVQPGDREEEKNKANHFSSLVHAMSASSCLAACAVICTFF